MTVPVLAGIGVGAIRFRIVPSLFSTAFTRMAAHFSKKNLGKKYLADANGKKGRF